MLEKKKILIFSPQSWGTMFLSKHHYAVELANRGNTVYFVNPPATENGLTSIQVSGIDSFPNLFLIKQPFKWWFRLKFHLPVLFRLIMKLRLYRILKKTGHPDFIWSFDLGNYYDLKFFKQSTKVFHPVDEPLNQAALDSGKGADVIFSVTNEILLKYQHIHCPRHFINHGISNSFVQAFDNNYRPGNPLRVGLSGNFTRPDIDWDSLVQIIKENTNATFEFFGSYKGNQSNIAGDAKASSQFIEVLLKMPNVIFHGPLSSNALAVELKRMDAFLICYDISKDQSSGTNYHKVMEYLSTGKVIVSSNITTYHDKKELLVLSQDRVRNADLPALFKDVIINIEQYNDASKRNLRYKFALSNTYAQQLNRIDQILEKQFNA